MALKSAQAFMEALQRDTALAAQFAAAAPTSLDEVMDFAASKGYFFPKDELVDELKNHPDSTIAKSMRQFVR